MKKQTLQLIENLNSDIDFNNISAHEGEGTFWEYYFSITGFYKEKHFSVTIFKGVANEQSTISVSSVTDCRLQINKKLKQFKIQ